MTIETELEEAPSVANGEYFIALVNRLRGIYTVPVTDGAGLLNGSDTFTKRFDNLPPIQGEAACAIEVLMETLAAITLKLQHANGDNKATLECIQLGYHVLDGAPEPAGHNMQEPLVKAVKRLLKQMERGRPCRPKHARAWANAMNSAEKVLDKVREAQQ